MSDSPLAIIPKEVWLKFYDDAVAPSAKQIGNISAGLLQASTYLLNPMLRAMIESRERLTRDLETVCDSVPTERQVEADPQVAGPAFERLRYLDDSNKLRELYLNLLRAAIDSEKRSDIHPRFVRILEQISSDDALVFWHLFKVGGLSKEISIREYRGERGRYVTVQTAFDVAKEKSSELADLDYDQRELILEALEANGLIRIGVYEDVEYPDIKKETAHVEITELGKRFAQVCLPEVFKP